MNQNKPENIKKLEKKIALLEKKLIRSEKNRAIIENINDNSIELLRNVNQDIIKANEDIKIKNNELLEMAEKLQQANQQLKNEINQRKQADNALLERNIIIEKDLQAAQIIQHALLIKEIPKFNHLNIDYRYYPLEAIGGDFFSIRALKEGGLGIFIGDVTGHGVTAALFLSLLKLSTDQVCRKLALNPKEYIRELNTILMGNIPNTYITAIYGLFQYNDSDSKMTFTFSKAGHPPPVYYSLETEEIHLLKSKGALIGVFDTIVTSDITVPMNKGDKIFLYTDGVSEIINTKGILLSDDEFLSMIKKSIKPNIGETLDSIMNEITIFQGDNKTNDDKILIGIEVI